MEEDNPGYFEAALGGVDAIQRESWTRGIDVSADGPRHKKSISVFSHHRLTVLKFWHGHPARHSCRIYSVAPLRPRRICMAVCGAAEPPAMVKLYDRTINDLQCASSASGTCRSKISVEICQ